MVFYFVIMNKTKKEIYMFSIRQKRNQWEETRDALERIRQDAELHSLSPESTQTMLDDAASKLGVNHPIHWKDIIALPFAKAVGDAMGAPVVDITGPFGTSSRVFVGLYETDIDMAAENHVLHFILSPERLLTDEQDDGSIIVIISPITENEEQEDDIPTDANSLSVSMCDLPNEADINEYVDICKRVGSSR
jgi:hypothetical protein